MTTPDITFRLPLLATVLLATALTACGGSSSNNGGTSSSSSSNESSSSSSESSSSSSASSDDSVSIDPDFQLYTLAEFPVGIAVSAANENYSIFNNTDGAARQDVVVEHFDQLTAGNIMKMSYLHPSEDSYTFGDADELVNFAKTNGMTVHGHALVWHSDYQVPNFMKNYDGDWEAMLTDHVTTIVNHFDETVVSWDVVNEAVDQNTDNGWRHSVFYNYEPPTDGEIPPYIEVAFQAAHAANAELDLYYNDYDNTANDVRRNKTLEIAERLNELGVIDGVGFQMHVYMGYPSLQQFENAFQAVVDLGLKVKITELDIPINDPYTGGVGETVTELTPEIANQQKQRFCEVITVYLETVPAELRGGVTIWGLSDDETWLISQYNNQFEDVWPLLFNADLSAKPALQGVADAFNGEPCSGG